jgi:hypothetical protein
MRRSLRSNHIDEFSLVFDTYGKCNNVTHRLLLMTSVLHWFHSLFNQEELPMMTTEPYAESELLVKFSRRGLWIALLVLGILGAYAVLINLFPDSAVAVMASRLARMLPIAIIIALVSLRSSLKSARIDPRTNSINLLLQDELRQYSLNRAYRNALAAVLLAQPILALLLTWTTLPYPVVLMASVTALIGTGTVVGSMLVYDR